MTAAQRRPCHCNRVETCTRCRLFHSDRRYRRLWGGDGWEDLPEPSPQSPPPIAGAKRRVNPVGQAPCRHLGGPTGETRDCRTCGGGTALPLHGCALHGVCSPGRMLDGVAWCRTCPQYKPTLACAD